MNKEFVLGEKEDNMRSELKTEYEVGHGIITIHVCLQSDQANPYLRISSSKGIQLLSYFLQ